MRPGQVLKIRKATAKATVAITSVKPPPVDRVRELNGPPVGVMSWREWNRLMKGQWSPWEDPAPGRPTGSGNGEPAEAD